MDPGGAAATAAGGASGSGLGGGSPTGNLVVNGDFSNGLSDWHTVTLPKTIDPNETLTSGLVCVQVPPIATYVSIGWPADVASAFSLVAGQMYLFSFQASWSGSLSFYEAKVGGAMSPNQDDFTAPTTAATMSAQALQTFSYRFRPTMGDPAAGVAFSAANADSSTTVTFCIANVSVTPVN